MLAIFNSPTITNKPSLLSARLPLLMIFLCLMLVACASPAPSVMPLAPEPKPVATATMMRTLPPPSSFRTKLSSSLSRKPTAQTK